MIYAAFDQIETLPLTENLKKALVFFNKNRALIELKEDGRYDEEGEGKFYYMVQSYDTKKTNFWESHQRYIDIQIVLEGREIIEVASLHRMKPKSTYNAEKDFQEWEGKPTITLNLFPGDFSILFPFDAHKPCLAFEGKSEGVKKCVFKVLI